MRKQIHWVVNRCEACQLGKMKRLKYGHVPPKEDKVSPWTHLCVDTIGPYKMQCKGQKDLEFQAVTLINLAIGWFENETDCDKRSQ